MLEAVKQVLGNEKKLLEKLVEKSGRSRRQITALVKEKLGKYGNTITQAAAAYAVAKDLGVEVLEKKKQKNTQISDLSPGEDTGTIIARVTKVYGPKTFSRNGRRGTVANLNIEDQSGKTRLVLWDDASSKVFSGKIERGNVLKIMGGVVKTKQGRQELHCGSTSSVETVGEKTSLPKAPSCVKKITQLSEQDKEIDVYARVLRLYPKKNYSTLNKTGSLITMLVGDDTGTARLVLWDSASENIPELKENEVVKIEGAKARNGPQGVEIHLDYSGRLIGSPKNPPAIKKIHEFEQVEKTRRQINQISEDKSVEIRGTVMNTYTNEYPFCPVCRKKSQDPCPQCGSKTQVLSVTNAEIDDGTGVIKTVAFGKLSEKLSKVKVGGEIIARGNVKKNQYTGRLELSVNSLNTQPDWRRETKRILRILDKH